MKIIFLDCETTGIPDMKLKKSNGVRIVQLSWIVVDNYAITYDNDFIIKPENFEIKNSHIHNITTERATKVGVPIQTALQYLLEDIKVCDRIVCYNAEFDKLMVDSEFMLCSMQVPALEWFCAMKDATAKYQKWPKLKDLYFTYFKENFIEHNSLSDAYACLRCYYWKNDKKDMKDEIESALKTLEPQVKTHA